MVWGIVVGIVVVLFVVVIVVVVPLVVVGVVVLVLVVVVLSDLIQKQNLYGIHRTPVLGRIDQFQKGYIPNILGRAGDQKKEPL